jgi:starch synthase
MFKVLFAASEAFPFVHTGGLGEVAGSLPLALAELDCEIRVVLPAYRNLERAEHTFTPVTAVTLPEIPHRIGLAKHQLRPGVEVWLVDYPPFFDRPGGPYVDEAGQEWSDNAARFTLFSRVVAALARAGMPDGWRPDIVHANDWQTALAPFFITHALPRPRTVFTIHNLAYRGLCDYTTYSTLGLPASTWHHESLEFHGQCALIKAGLVYADRITTVSPTYAREIQTPDYGYGLDGVLRHRASVLSGVLNGIDEVVWDPARDPLIASPYRATDLIGKRNNKRALQAAFGLPQDDRQFLVGTVTRLAEQKGVDLMLEACPTLLDQPIQWVFLGSGEPTLERQIVALGDGHSDRVGYRIGFDTAVSHAVFAGLDAFLMPSRFEPCGLSQLYSQRYGTVPIVRRTGGLADSVRDAADPTPTGFLFDAPTSGDLRAAILRALQAYRDPVRWHALQQNGMAQDFSWRHSARAYLDIYRAAFE